MADFNPAEIVTKFRTAVGNVHQMANALQFNPTPGLKQQCLDNLKVIADALRPLSAVQLVKVMKEWYWHTDLHSTDGVIFAALLLEDEEYLKQSLLYELQAQLDYAKTHENGLQNMLAHTQQRTKELQKALEEMEEEANEKK